MDINKDLHNLFINLKFDREKAIEQIYNEYKDTIYKIAFSILKDGNDADDVVQNVIIKIFRLENEKLPRNKELSWIYTVTKNEAITVYKLKNKNDNIDNIYEIKCKDNQIGKLEDIIYFNQIIKKLKPIDQEIVSLKLISDLSFHSISKILDMPIGTVEWRYYKSIKFLKTSVIISILLTISIVGINENHNKINEKNEEINKIIALKEEEENNIKNNEQIPENELANSIPKENNTSSENIKMYEEMLVNIDEDISNINKFNMGIILFIIIFAVVLIVNLFKYRKFRKLKVRIKDLKVNN